MDVIDLDMLNNQRIANNQYDRPIKNITDSATISFSNNSISIYDLDSRIKSMSEILNEIGFRFAALKEKEKEREQECVCETLI